MTIPPMYLVNCAVSWAVVALAAAAFFYVRRKTGQKWLFWPLFATAYGLFAVSHTLLIVGVATDAWYMTVLRIFGYAFLLGALAHLMYDKIVKYRQLTAMAGKVRDRQSGGQASG